MSDQTSKRFSVVQGRRGENKEEAPSLTPSSDDLVNPQVIQDVVSKASLKVVEGRLGTIVETARVIAFPVRQLSKKTIFQMVSLDGRPMFSIERL